MTGDGGWEWEIRFDTASSYLSGKMDVYLKTTRIWPTGYHSNDCRNLAYFVPIEVEREKITERERRLCILKAPQEVIKGQCPVRCLVSK